MKWDFMTPVPWRDIPPLFRFVALCGAILALDAALKLWIG